MVTLQVHYQGGDRYLNDLSPAVEAISEHETVEEAVTEARRVWNESEDTSEAVTVWEGEQILATLIKPLNDRELCITVYADGRIERHRCVYVLREDGMYHHTEITPVEMAVV